MFNSICSRWIIKWEDYSRLRFYSVCPSQWVYVVISNIIKNVGMNSAAFKRGVLSMSYFSFDCANANFKQINNFMEFLRWLGHKNAWLTFENINCASTDNCDANNLCCFGLVLEYVVIHTQTHILTPVVVVVDD